MPVTSRYFDSFPSALPPFLHLSFPPFFITPPLPSSLLPFLPPSLPPSLSCVLPLSRDAGFAHLCICMTSYLIWTSALMQGKGLFPEREEGEGMKERQGIWRASLTAGAMEISPASFEDLALPMPRYTRIVVCCDPIRPPHLPCLPSPHSCATSLSPASFTLECMPCLPSPQRMRLLWRLTSDTRNGGFI